MNVSQCGANTASTKDHKYLVVCTESLAAVVQPKAKIQERLKDAVAQLKPDIVIIALSLGNEATNLGKQHLGHKIASRYRSMSTN